MTLSGLITGTLGYSLKRDFIANAIALRETETFNYEIYAVDMVSMDANQIQNQIKNQFSSVYSGDINVTAFATQHGYAFNSDSLRAARFNVTVEIKKPVVSMSTLFPELGSGYYAGLDATFFTSYGQYLQDFNENFGFATNANGNREFSHDVSFGLRTGWSSASTTQTGRKAYAQTLVSGIFASDKDTTFGISTMIGLVTPVADSSVYRNYFTETYDLFKNTYSFSRKRELLPKTVTFSTVNFGNSLTMNADGTIDVSEKATATSVKDFSFIRTYLETYYAGAFGRCSGFYNQFYNTGVLIQDPQYSGNSLTNSNLLPLINTPVKLVKNYDTRSLNAGYDVSYTNNPTFSGDGTITTQTIEFEVDSYDKVEATHTYDFTVNRINNNSGYFVTLMNNITGNSPTVMGAYYTGNFPTIYGEFSGFNLVKSSVSWPNTKTRSSAKFSYSNHPSYFVTVDGIVFRVFDFNVETKKPVDMVQEYKVINRPNKKSVLSYGYQTDRGETVVSLKIALGKQSRQFYPDSQGSFGTFDGVSLASILQAVYKMAGQIFLTDFANPVTAWNWFISDSKFNLDSEGNLSVTINYTYTIKKRSADTYP